MEKLLMIYFAIFSDNNRCPIFLTIREWEEGQKEKKSIEKENVPLFLL